MKTLTKPYYKVSSIDKHQGIIFVRPVNQNCDLSRLFRQVESEQDRINYMKPWRVIYTDSNGLDYEIKIDYKQWPRSYLQWDRRYNPCVKTERWYGLPWDILKNAE